MLLPYRAKNPPVVFPWVTVALIAFNVLIFALTSENFLQIRNSVLMQYGLIHNRFSIERLFVSMFLHANTIHLLGNMLFLWVFGGAVEGRMGWYLFLPFYLTVGLASGVFHDLMSGALNPDMPALGASGAIMGVMGAYLWLAPFAHILVGYLVSYGIFRIKAGTMTWQALWLILFYFASDVLEGFLFRGTGGGGTANFAHIGGMLTGFSIAMISGMARESEEFSDAQAARSDLGNDLSVLSVYELEPLINGPQPQVDAVFAYCRKRLREESGYKYALSTMTRHADLILEKGNAEQFAIVALDIPHSAGRLPAQFLLTLGQKLEIDGAYETAGRLYRHIMIGNEIAPETEMALLRLARLTEQTNADKGFAAAIYQEQLRLFANGTQAALARTALGRLPKPIITFSANEGRHQGQGVAAPAAPGGPAPAPLGGMAPVGVAPVGPAPAPAGGMASIGMAPVGVAPAGETAPAGMAPVGMASIGMAPVGLAPVAPPAPPAAAPAAPVQEKTVALPVLAAVGMPSAPQPAPPAPPPTPDPIQAKTPAPAHVPGQFVAGSPLPAGFWDTPAKSSAPTEEAPPPTTSLPPVFLAPVGAPQSGGSKPE